VALAKVFLAKLKLIFDNPVDEPSSCCFARGGNT
jgi:hypothetical protein